MTDITNNVNAVTKEELEEITAIFMDLPKADRAILLSNANAFKTLRNIEEDT